MRELGRATGLRVPAQGLGCMGISWAYGAHSPADTEVAATAFDAYAAAVGAGTPLHLDTGWIYSTWQEDKGVPHNETLVGHAIKKFGRANVVVGDKLGVDIRTPPNVFRQAPAELAQQLEESLARLGTDYLDIFYLNRPAPHIPIEDSMRVLAGFVKAGKVRHVGLIEVCAEDVRRAHAVHPVAAVQLEWSVIARDAEAAVIPACRELGIGIVAYCPIARGLLSGDALPALDSLPPTDFRKMWPRTADPAALAANKAKAAVVAKVAARLGATSAQVALAWVHAQGSDVFPIPGSRDPARIAENVAAFKLRLSAEDMAELDAIGEAVGDRYGHGNMMTHQWREQKLKEARGEGGGAAAAAAAH